MEARRQADPRVPVDIVATVTAGRFELEDLDALAPLWDAAVDRTPGVDPFCASTTWAFAAAHAFPEASAPIVVGDGAAFCGMRTVRTEQGPVLVGLDPIWGFATPFVGQPLRAAEMLARRVGLDDDWSLAVVAGQREDSPLTAALAHVADRRWRLLRGAPEHRLRVDLSRGVDAWFARRSSRFRQRLRRIERDAAESGIEVRDVSALDPDRAFERLLAVEEGSWKGSQGTGLASADLQGFYRQMCVRLAARDHLRILVAQQDGRDVGFVLGGIRGNLYRGLQLSYVTDLADLGLGHLLQLHQLRRLEVEGVGVYDLGMDMPYKRRWADRIDETISVILAR